MSLFCHSNHSILVAGGLDPALKHHLVSFCCISIDEYGPACIAVECCMSVTECCKSVEGCLQLAMPIALTLQLALSSWDDTIHASICVWMEIFTKDFFMLY